MRRRILALILAVASLLTLSALAGCSAKPVDATFTVGTPSMNGDFIYGFGNSSYDKYVKDLTCGMWYYSLYSLTPEGELPLNKMVVKNSTTETDSAGNKSYIYELQTDLKWNDGTKITAKDYVFAMLFQASPQWQEAGAVASDGDSLLGYTDYHEGTTDVFAGVKLLGDYKFSFTIDAANLPYYYEDQFTNTFPLCSAVWAPNCTIESTDAGAKIAGVDLKACAEAVAGGERFAPTVTCGPYKFVSYEDQIATLTANEYFKEDMNGYGKPKIKNIVVKSVNQDTDVDQVISGDIDMVTGVIEGAKIDASKASSNVAASVYPRNGFGQMAFACDFGPTADVNVRWGIASLIDRREIVNHVCGGYAVTVDSEYGLAQWMYQEKKDQLLEQIKPISFNIDAANDFFDLSDYKFEADGSTPFDRAKANKDGTYLRHNSAGEVFEINHLGTDQNPVTDAVELQYKSNAPMAGVKVNIEKSDFDALLNNYYYGYEQGEDRKFHSFNLGLGFSEVFDPYYDSYHSDFIGTYANSCQISDAELDRTIIELRQTAPGDTDTFANRWLDYQVRWNQLLPCVPLYSSEYYDIYNTRITDVKTTPFLSWAQSVCSIKLAG